MATNAELNSKVDRVATDLGWVIKIGSGAGVIAIGFAGWLLASYIPNQLDKTKAEMKVELQTQLLPIQQQLAAITAKTVLKSNPKDIHELLKKNVQQPNSATALANIAALTQEARQQQIATDPKPISQLGDQVIKEVNWGEGTIKPVAWTAVTGLMEYCSYLQQTNLPNLRIAPLFSGNWKMDFGSMDSRDAQTKAVMYGRVPAKDAARGQHIGQEPYNVDIEQGPALVVVEASHANQTLKLDDHSEKNMVYVGFQIEYDGGPIALDHVTFINCTFRVQPTDKGRGFGQALFAGSPVNFNTSTT